MIKAFGGGRVFGGGWEAVGGGQGLGGGRPSAEEGVLVVVEGLAAPWRKGFWWRSLGGGGGGGRLSVEAGFSLVERFAVCGGGRG